jgi:hypothetical protein
MGLTKGGEIKNVTKRVSCHVKIIYAKVNLLLQKQKLRSNNTISGPVIS